MHVRLRPISTDDQAALGAAYQRLSPLSRQRRFGSPKARLSRRDLAYLTDVDGIDHVAWVAVDEDGDIIGVGRWVRDPERPDTAEFAIVVGDPYQGQGVGRALAERLSAEARARGVSRFTALVRADNEPVRRLVARIATRLEGSTAVQDGMSELTIGLAA
jgi:RimJ/RimL family protein N-acetyltransferase